MRPQCFPVALRSLARRGAALGDERGDLCFGGLRLGLGGQLSSEDKRCGINAKCVLSVSYRRTDPQRLDPSAGLMGNREVVAGTKDR